MPIQQLISLMTQIALPLFFAFFSGWLFTKGVIKLAPHFLLMDDPRRKHPAILHRRPVARGGGLPLFLSFFLTTFLFLPRSAYLLAIWAGSFINVLVGTIDDRVDLSPKIRLFVTLPLATLPVILAGINMTVSNPLGNGIISFRWIPLNLSFLPATVYLPEALLLMFWIIWMCNVVNWTKGASQLPGIAVVAFLALGGVSLKYQAGNPHQIETAQLSLILAAGSLAFLPFNFPPERIFPGFGGSTFIGFNLAVLSVLSGGKLAAALLVLGIPVVDMFLSFARRIREGKNPLYGDRGHLYHLFLDLGLTKKQVIVVYWLITLGLGFFALGLEREKKLFAIVFVFLLTSMIFLTARWLVGRLPRKTTQT